MSVHFESGKSTLSAKDKLRLDSLVWTFETELNYQIKLVGHTDSIGGLGYNKTLSENRALAVQKYLSGKKKKNVSIVKAGKAFYIPVQANSNENGRAENRRCELYVEETIPKGEPWAMPVQQFSLKNKKKNILYTKNGCKVIIEPGSFKVKENDTVRILITEYNNPADFIAGGFPMSYSKEGKTRMYHSEQMMKIEAFVDSVPVTLVKLMGLQCPNVDTSRSVRLYEFKAEENSQKNVFSKIAKGRVEEVEIELPKEEPEEKELPEELVKENKNAGVKVVEENKEPLIEEKKESKNVTIKKKKEEILIPIPKKEIPAKKASAKRKKKVSGFELEPDTGRFTLIPDTGRAFFFTYNDNHYKERANGWKDVNLCWGIKDCYVEICDTTQIKEQIEFGLQFKDKGFNIVKDFDGRFFEARYRNLAYSGMKLKCNIPAKELYPVKLEFKKRFLHKDFNLKIISFKNNPEYKALQSTKWRIHYDSKKAKAELLKTIKIFEVKISDVKIMPVNDSYYDHGIAEDFFVELKSEDGYYRMTTKPKGLKKTIRSFKVYQDDYKKREEAFNDSINKYFERIDIGKLFCLYKITSSLSCSVAVMHPCAHRPDYYPPCYPFSFFSKRTGPSRSPDASIRSNDCLGQYKGVYCDIDFFVDWIYYYDEYKDELEQKLTYLKNNQSKIYDCLKCKKDTTVYSEPCSKWEYANNHSNEGNKIVYIGLGVYNFDSEMVLEKKQSISNAVYLNKEGDTLFKCKNVLNRWKQPEKSCSHIMYTVIPEFNGLLKQNNTAILTLLPGKENILFFQKYNRSYKLYLDLRNVKEYKGRTFILKDITKEASTLDGLTEELKKRE